MRLFVPLLVASTLMLGGCDDAPAPKSADTLPPFVKTVAVTGGTGQTLGLSGTVRARVESSLAFQVGGRISRRAVDAGQSVKVGRVLFELDKRDLEQSVASGQHGGLALLQSSPNDPTDRCQVDSKAHRNAPITVGARLVSGHDSRPSTSNHCGGAL